MPDASESNTSETVILVSKIQGLALLTKGFISIYFYQFFIL